MTSPVPYPLSTAMAAFVLRSEAFPLPDNARIAAHRDSYRRMAAAFTPPRPAGVDSDDLFLEGSASALAVRRYRPPGTAPANGWPAVLYCHGGGWCLGDLDSHDFIAAALCASVQAVVLVVDYRLAPEHPFPAAFEDCLTAWHCLQTGPRRLDIDPGRVALVGDSAGGNLVAALCLALRREDSPPPRAQALVYPGLAAPTTDATQYASRQEHARAPLLSWADVLTYWRQYVTDPALDTDWRAAPLSCPDLTGVPPAFVAVAEFDPLRDEGIDYVNRLLAAGIPAQVHFGRGLVHGCLRALGACSETEKLYAALRTYLRAALA